MNQMNQMDEIEQMELNTTESENTKSKQIENELNKKEPHEVSKETSSIKKRKHKKHKENKECVCTCPCNYCIKKKQKITMSLEQIKKTREYKFIKKYYEPDMTKSVKVKSLHDHYLELYENKKNLLSRMQFKRLIEAFLPSEILTKNKNQYILYYYKL